MFRFCQIPVMALSLHVVFCFSYSSVAFSGPAKDYSGSPLEQLEQALSDPDNDLPAEQENILLPQPVQDIVKSTAMLIYNRITGVPPTPEVLTQMVGLVQAGKIEEAAELAMNNPNFYNLVLRSMFTGWSNVSGDVGTDLNDMVATLIGLVRDDIPFGEVLWGDHLYVGADTQQQGAGTQQQENGTPPYALNSNAHYVAIQDENLKEILQQKKQSEMDGALPDKAIAGVLSTRGFAEAYFSAGTNRRATAFVMKHFLCHEMEMLHDTDEIREDFIRQDVDRAPGKDHALFKGRCLGCHAGMDALSGWSVYYDFRNITTAGWGVAHIRGWRGGRYMRDLQQRSPRYLQSLQ